MKVPRITIAAIIVAALVGCDSSPDQRLADMAEKVTDQQSEQNQRMAEGNKAIAEGTKNLVKAEAEARKALIDLQQDLRRDQSDVAEQRNELELERKTIAKERVQESMSGSICFAAVIVLVCLAPLVLAALSLLGLWTAPTKEEEGQVLIEELTAALGNDVRHISPAEPPSTLPPPNAEG